MGDSPFPSGYCVYVLRSCSGKRSYIGAAKDIRRRIRQHNGDICGGARYTRTDRPWSVQAAVFGFKQNRCAALSFEWYAKRGKRGVHSAEPYIARVNRIRQLVLEDVSSRRVRKYDNTLQDIHVLMRPLE
jgi:putative endonuclease